MNEISPQYTIKRKCGYCGNTAPMVIVGGYKEVLQEFIGKERVHIFDYGERYELLKCQSCEKIELEAHSYHEGLEEPIFNFRTLYPESISLPDGLPKKVKGEYEKALKARHGDSNGYGVLLGRVLEAVCHDKKAKGKTIGEQLKDLADRNELPTEIITFAKTLNRLRVFGAHFNVGKLTSKDIPIMEKLTKVILEYVYAAPFIIKQAEKIINKVDGKKSSPPQMPETKGKTQNVIPIRRILVKDIPLGDFEEISIEMPDWELKFLNLIANKKLIKYDVYTMPNLSHIVRVALHHNKYRDLILLDDQDQHYLIAKGT